jgi:hypothetical protein
LSLTSYYLIPCIAAVLIHDENLIGYSYYHHYARQHGFDFPIVPLICISDLTVMNKGIFLQSRIDVENITEIALFVATRDSSVTIPQIALYPTHKIHRYGMEV